MNKQQAAWWGYPHKDANGVWHRGWLSKFENRRRRAQASASTGSNKNELKEIHSMLNEAVDMLKSYEHKGSMLSTGTGRSMSHATADRLKKVEGEASRSLPGVTEYPKCFINNEFTDADRAHFIRRMGEAADNLVLSYPDWAKGQSIPGRAQDGEWRHDRGPPYVQRLTMFSGQGVDTISNGDLVRRILGLNKAFQKPCDLRSCDHAFTGNQYLKSFDGSQFRFLYRNQCSAIVVPPLTNGAGPILNHNGMYRLHHYLKDGYNTLIVTGGVANILFINQNVATLDGGFSLEPNWVDGPYEAQAAQGANTPFAALSVTLPGPGVAVTGVKISSLPRNAISYYEAEDTSVVFEIPMGTGRIIYLGYDYSEPVTPWVHALIASTMFNDYDFKAPPPEHMARSVNRWGVKDN